MRINEGRAWRNVASMVAFAVSVSTALLTLACSAAMQPGNTETLAPARYDYAAPAASGRIAVSLGVMNVVFPRAQDASDADNQALAAATTQGFYDLLVAKGFTVSGPHESLDAMTYPEKRNVALVVYPEFNIQWNVEEFAQDVSAGGMLRAAHHRSRFRVSVSGFVTLTAMEPLSQQRMWTKRINVQTTPVETSVIERTREGANGPLQNAYNRSTEAVYALLMGEVDRFVNAEEFTVLARDVEQLRAQTNFGAH